MSAIGGRAVRNIKVAFTKISVAGIAAKSAHYRKRFPLPVLVRPSGHSTYSLRPSQRKPNAIETQSKEQKASLSTSSHERLRSTFV